MISLWVLSGTGGTLLLNIEGSEIIIETAIAIMPWWEKYTFSVQEAAEYFGISDKKIRAFIEEHKDANFILWNGTRPRIKRKLFEKYVDEKLTTI